MIGRNINIMIYELELHNDRQLRNRGTNTPVVNVGVTLVNSRSGFRLLFR